MTVPAWNDGTAHTLTETAWTEICASFLGVGFRVGLPGGDDRKAAAQHEAIRVRRLADVVGAHVAEVDWDLAAQALPLQAVEIVGGWPRTYTGTPSMWIAVVPIDDPTLATAALLPTPRHPSPTTGLPMFSRLVDELALSSLDADCGIWANADRSVATSTAGPIIGQRSDGTWAMGTDSGGWSATRIARQRGASADLRVEDLPAALLVGVVTPSGSVQPLTYVRS